MPYATTALVVLVIVAIVLWMSRRSRLYRRIFNDDHYAEIARWASKVIGIHPVESPSIDDGTAVVTSAGVALAYTSSVDDDGNRSIHFSVSQQGGTTTRAVGGRVLFLLVRLLHTNNSKSELFASESTVHHVIFTMRADKTWEVQPVTATVADMAHYLPQPVARVNVA